MSSNLSNLSSAEIVKQYNQAAAALGRPEIKKFKNKETAIARTEAILAELPQPAAAEPKKPGKRGGPLNLPFRGYLHKVRKETLTEQLVDALRAGTTMDEMLALTQAKLGKGTLADVRGYVRALHTYTGFGIRQDGERIYLVEE